MENINTNQNYRKMLIKSAFETMKENQRNIVNKALFICHRLRMIRLKKRSQKSEKIYNFIII